MRKWTLQFSVDDVVFQVQRGGATDFNIPRRVWRIGDREVGRDRFRDLTNFIP